MKFRVLIVVPARAGSKGLSGKNARVLGDLPLLGWTAEAIRRAGIDDALTVLSTDDETIADIGRSVGLRVPFMRPEELASDTASAESVAQHALSWADAAAGGAPPVVMWLQPTSPFRPPESLRAGLALMATRGAAAVVGVKPLHRSLRTLFHADDAFDLRALDPEAPSESRRQAGRTLYTPNGALYIVSTDALRNEGTFFPARSAGVRMDQIASIDIDDPTDWAMAEAIAAAGLSWRGRITGA